MPYRNARFITNEIIDCEINHPVHGWIPYTLDPADTDSTINNADLLAEMGSDITPYAPPTAAENAAARVALLTHRRATAVLSRAQFIQAVYRAGILTKAEAIAASANVPAFFLTALGSLVTAGAMTQAEADDAEILWLNLLQVERNHPFLPIAQGALNLTTAQVDALFGIGT
tara:strand:+ start:9644 stop:10159 length:516 start_codon:yes stop_codon:yes gene_type:complete